MVCIHVLAMKCAILACDDCMLHRSMLPDVVDAAYSERGVRREELFYAYFVFGIKCSAGLSLGISTGIYR